MQDRAVRTTFIPELADGQSSDRLLQAPVLFLKVDLWAAAADRRPRTARTATSTGLCIPAVRSYAQLQELRGRGDPARRSG
jgi:hypothetical protein